MLAEAAQRLSPQALGAAKAAAAIMGMNNIYYRFTHLVSSPDYKTMPARLRMNVIANPGVESIRAALSPASVDYLFFVARPDGSGHHEFNQSLAAHEAAATRYRRGQQSNQPKAPGRPVPAR